MSEGNGQVNRCLPNAELAAGWETKRLGDLCEFYRGLTYKKPDEVDSSKNIVLRANNIDLDSNILDFTELRFISDKITIPDNKRLKKDSLIVCTASGSKRHLGKVAYIDSDYDYAFGGFMGMITPSQALVPKYLFHLMTSPAYKEFINNLTDGININNLKFNDLKTFAVPFPPLPEQRRIVAILDEAFAGIATARANAERNLRNARAVFESHLEGVFSRRGEGWVEKRLKDIATDFGRGRSRHRPRNEPTLYGGKYPFVQTGDVRNAEHVINSYRQTYSEHGLAQSKLWPKGTVCITIAANIAETAILGFDGCFPDSMIGVVVDERSYSNTFLQYLLESFKIQLQAEGKGSAQDNINLGTFERRLFPFPPLDRQREIAVQLNALQEQTKNLQTLYQRKLAALDELKKSLLDRAFSGRL